MIKLKNLILEAGAVKFTPSLINKIESIVEEYLNDAYELLYVNSFIKSGMPYVLKQAKDEFPDIYNSYKNLPNKLMPIYLKRELKDIKEVYPHVKNYKYGSKYSIDFVNKKVTYINGGEQIINRKFILSVDKDKDLPPNYLKVFENNDKLSVPIYFKHHYFKYASGGFYDIKLKRIYIISPALQGNNLGYDTFMDNIVDAIQHEFIHHLQFISDLKFGINKHVEPDIRKDYYLYDDVEFYPYITTMANRYESNYDGFNNQYFEEFVKDNIKPPAKKNEKEYKKFVGALYSELEKRYKK